jgi:protein SCO1/2
MRGERSVGVTAAASLLGAAAFFHIGLAFAANPWGADYFPNVPLTTQDGATVYLYDDLLKGKAVAINAIYTNCKDECPLETARMAQVQRLLGERFGKDIFFYSITIDPERDSPKVLKAYAEQFGAGPGWLFLTGKKEDIKLVTKKLGLSSLLDSGTRDGHVASLMLGNGTGQWMRNSALDNPRFLVATIRNFMGWRDSKPGKSYAEARPLKLEQGKYIFGSQCSACHTIGQGHKVGPDLLGVTNRRERAWLARYILAPDEMLDAGDPVATALFKKYKNVRMPNLRLGSADVAALLSYLETQSSVPREPTRKESVSSQ